ncbi:MAG TPA: 3,4-dihydroxy-2-butanone-4-phosphate synthase [Kineosporiaceae bacterium]
MTSTVPPSPVPAAVPEPAVRLDRVEDALAALHGGLPVIVVDDADRENEGDVVLAAEHATPQWVAWTVRHTSGLLCAPMPEALADALELPPMVERNQDRRGTAYTVSVDAREGVTTGISAADRARTARLLADPGTTPGDLVRPGHLFPLRARDGGVLERRGHTEAAVDLCRLAGLAPVGVIAELVDDDGTMMRLPAMRRLADTRGLPVISVEALADHRLRHEAPAGPPPVLAARVSRVARTQLPTRHGRLTAVGYRDQVTGAEHVALVCGTPSPGALVRVHSECLTGDSFGSLRCDCGPQLDAALAAISGPDGGAVVYLRGHEGRGIGLLAKLTAYSLQDGGLDTVAANLQQGLPADAREYGAAAAILADLGLGAVRLLTNNPAKVAGLRAAGVDVVERVPLHVGAGPLNQSYLRAKRDLMGHLIEEVAS